MGYEEDTERQMATSKKETKHYVVVRASAGGTTGRYSSTYGPAAAAKKAAKQRFTGSTNKVRITVRETGTEREFTYDVERKKLAEPKVRKIGNSEVRNMYEIKCKAVKK